MASTNGDSDTQETYEILVATDDETAEFHGTASGNWTSDSYLIAEGNEYPTVEDALEAIDMVRALDEDAAGGTYAVAVIGNRSSLVAVVRP